MPEIATTRDDIRDLAGLHLWHAGLSNCSQRVRLVLEEKGLAWTSHPVDLLNFEHATPEYQAIHPKGLVPALVHDGRTIIDSNDIIEHLDGAFPAIRLSRSRDRRWLDLADGCQSALRTISHEILLKEVRILDAARLEDFGRKHRNRDFHAFLHRFATTGFDDEALTGCARVLSSALDQIERQLRETRFLAGDDIALDDFSWATNIHRLRLMDWPLAAHPRISDWYFEIEARDSFKAAVVAFEENVPAPSARARGRLENVLRSVGLQSPG
jgi:glutathione S-transferase